MRDGISIILAYQDTLRNMGIVIKYTRWQHEPQDLVATYNKEPQDE